MSSLRRRFGALIPLLILCLGLALAGPVRASDAYSARGVSDAYTARGIEVDVTAAGVAAAKEQALAEAERVGFRRVLERLTVPADHGRLPVADARNYVRDVAIDQERSSSVRYIATLTVRYHGTAIKKLLRESGLKFAEPRPRAIVVAPLLLRQGGAPVWAEANPWRAAWAGLGGGGLVPLAVAAADPADPDSAMVSRIAALDPETLAALGARHRSGDVLVATAAIAADGGTVEVRLTGVPGLARPFDARVFPVGAEGVEATLRVAAADIAQGLDTLYKQANLLAFDRATSLPTLAPLHGLDDWLAVRDRLGRVPLVRRWDIVSLTRDEAALTLHVVGETEQVRAALAAAGLSLDQSDGFWTLRTLGGR